MDGGEVLPRADKSRMLAHNWLHFIFVVILVVGTVVGVATLQWGTLIKDVDPDPQKLYTECGVNEFQCRTQRLDCPNIDGKRDYQCKAPAGKPLCLRHNVQLAKQRLCMVDQDLLVAAGVFRDLSTFACHEASDIKATVFDLVRNGYYDCIAENQVVYDFSDEAHDQTTALRFVATVTVFGSAIVLYTFLGLVTGTADSYNQVKIFHDFAARPKQSPGLSPVTSGGTDTSSSPKSRAMTPVEVTMSSPTERQQDHNAEAQPPLTGVRLAAIDSLSPMPGQVGEEAAASD